MTADPGFGPTSPAAGERLGVVVIGRNEAPRLARALAALHGQPGSVVYVDSGSSDGSPEIAQRAGIRVVPLTEGPYSAAKGRTAGVDRLSAEIPNLRYIQFIDGDCAIADGWLAEGVAFLDAHPDAAAVVGRLREENAGSSMLIRLVEVEWDLPEGETDVIGGISLMRLDALQRAGGWRSDLVAGEELDLSSRLRASGYTLHRLARDMCRHDIGITRLSEFWKRSVRTGHSYAQLAALHHATGPRRWLRRTIGHVFYGLLLPLVGVIALVVYWPAALIVLTIYGLLVVRMGLWRLRRNDPLPVALSYAVLTTVCKVAAGLGVLKFLKSSLTGRRSSLIEYKAPAGAPPTQGGGN